jgi:phosphate-selective porin OprO/OprP
MTFTLGGPATTLTVGKTKETFAYEMVGDAANLAQQERVLSPFFVSRNVGAKLTRVFGTNQRLILSGGVFNDWWVSGTARTDSGTDVSARATGLAWDQPDRKRFLHLGLSGRHAGADMNALRYKGRPESNVADNYVDLLTVRHGRAVAPGLRRPASRCHVLPSSGSRGGRRHGLALRPAF